MSFNRKGSDASKIIPLCATCDTSIDSDAIHCQICVKAFHPKRECSGLSVAAFKAVASSDNLSYVCNGCKSISLGDILARFSAIEKEVASLRHQLAEKISSDMCQIVNDAITEHESRMEKRNNVMIFGLQESEQGSESDVDAVMFALDINTVDVLSYDRIDKFDETGRKILPLRIRFRCIEEKILCLKWSKNLHDLQRYRKVFVKQDLTRLQLEDRKRLLAEFNTRKEKGEENITRKYLSTPFTFSLTTPLFFFTTYMFD